MSGCIFKVFWDSAQSILAPSCSIHSLQERSRGMHGYADLSWVSVAHTNVYAQRKTDPHGHKPNHHHPRHAQNFDQLHTNLSESGMPCKVERIETRLPAHHWNSQWDLSWCLAELVWDIARPRKKIYWKEWLLSALRVQVMPQVQDFYVFRISLWKQLSGTCDLGRFGRNESRLRTCSQSSPSFQKIMFRVSSKKLIEWIVRSFWRDFVKFFNAQSEFD